MATKNPDDKLKLPGNRKPIYMPGHDQRGWEIPDPDPVALPVYVRQGASTLDQLRQQAFAAQQLQQAMAHVESFEEADDFEVGDDYERLPLMDEIDNRNDYEESVRTLVRETLLKNEAKRNASRGTRDASGINHRPPDQTSAPANSPAPGASVSTGSNPNPPVPSS